MTVTPLKSKTQSQGLIDHRAIWRWHFYAGLFCLPFILILAISGSAYLFKPQIEASLDRPYDQLAFTGPPASADAQVAAALEALPGARLKTLEVRQGLHDSVRVTVKVEGEDQLVYVHPQSLAILKIVPTKDRQDPVLARPACGHRGLGLRVCPCALANRPALDHGPGRRL